jgi:formylglycine-generating enzyme required for sulfatase activity
MKAGVVPKTIVILFFILFSCGLSVVPEASGEPLYGDVNKDQVVDLTDALVALQIVIAVEVQGPINLEAAVRGDGRICLADAIYVLQVVGALRGPTERRGFVKILAGSFNMGDDTVTPSDEIPVRPVTITQDFYMGKFEVTQKEWVEVMGTTPWLDGGGQPKDFVRVGDDYPATYVTWDDVQAFIAAKGPNYRLPTEAEWEYACRAGSETRFHYGDNPGVLGVYAIYRDNSWDEGRRYPHIVGLKLPNAWGLYDTHGNVWEWCHDWYAPYQYEDQTDPTGPPTGEARVIRSGSFRDISDSCRSAKRDFRSPTFFKFADLGFRLVYTGDTPPE